MVDLDFQGQPTFFILLQNMIFSKLKLQLNRNTFHTRNWTLHMFDRVFIAIFLDMLYFSGHYEFCRHVGKKY